MTPPEPLPLYAVVFFLFLATIGFAGTLLCLGKAYMGWKTGDRTDLVMGTLSGVVGVICCTALMFIIIFTPKAY